MSSKYVRDQIAAFLAANWSATVIAGVENEFEEPPQDVSGHLVDWLSYSFASAIEQRIGLGRSPVCMRESGEIYVNVFVPSGTGNDTALTYAESVRTLFRNTELNGIVFDTVDPPDTFFPSQAQSSMGNWFAYQVTIPYEYDYST